jgi:hypothetical protein
MTLPRRLPRTDEERQLTIERRVGGRGAFGGRSEKVAPVARRVQGQAARPGGPQHSPIWAESPEEPADLPADWFWFDTDDPGPVLPGGASATPGDPYVGRVRRTGSRSVGNGSWLTFDTDAAPGGAGDTSWFSNDDGGSGVTGAGLTVSASGWYLLAVYAVTTDDPGSGGQIALEAFDDVVYDAARCNFGGNFSPYSSWKAAINITLPVWLDHNTNDASAGFRVRYFGATADIDATADLYRIT